MVPIRYICTAARRDNAAAEFNVTPRLTSIDPEEGQVGSTITIEGDGFVATAPSIYVYWDEARVTPVTGSTVSTTGELSNFKITVPPSTRGEHTIRLEDRKNDNFSTDDAIFQRRIQIHPDSNHGQRRRHLDPHRHGLCRRRSERSFRRAGHKVNYSSHHRRLAPAASAPPSLSPRQQRARTRSRYRIPKTLKPLSP